MHSITLAIAAGDYNGIGPEILIKSLSDRQIGQNSVFKIFGSREIFRNTFEQFDRTMQSRFKHGYTKILDNLHPNSSTDPVEKKDFSPGIPTLESGQAAYRYLSEAVKYWQEGKCHGIVTAPIVKRTIFQKNSRFNGQTEWIAHQVGCSEQLMMMVKDKLRIGLVTTHISIREIPANLTVDGVISKGILLNESLVRDFAIERPRIALCGLNPHCGEEGTMGDEEKTILEPALNALHKAGGDWTGPLPSDTLFESRLRTTFDGILALYHDQGLIPFKMYSKLHGVNFTAGLPLVRTSPDHGVAMDIAGKGLADDKGFKEAILLAEKIAERRANSADTG